MNKYTFLLIGLALFSFASCDDTADCEEKTFEVSADLLKWLPYEANTLVTFVDQDNQPLSFSISPDVNTRIETDDNECMSTFVEPFILLENDDKPDFLQVWFLRQEDSLMDNDQLWGILKEGDQIVGSGAIVNIVNPDLIASQVTLYGLVFDDVITLQLESNGTTAITVYLQKEVGIIGLEFDEKLWVISQ